MECEKARYLMNLYAVNEISQEELYALKNHLNNCESCKEEFSESQKMDSYLNDLFEEVELPDKNFCNNVLDIVTDKNKGKLSKRRAWFMRRKAAICAAAMMICLLFAPFNGKPVFAHISNWVKNITVQNNHSEIRVVSNVSDVSLGEIEELKEFSSDDKSTVYIENRKTYDSLEKFKEAIGEECLILPSYLPENYKFTSGSIIEFKELDNLRLEIEYDNKDRNQNSVPLKISMIVYQPLVTHVTTEINNANKRIDVKKIQYQGVNGVISRQKFNSNLHLKSMFILDTEGYDLEVSSFCSEGEQNLIEEEILKVSESLIKEIKDNVDVIQRGKMKYYGVEFWKNHKEFNNIKEKDSRIIKLSKGYENYKFEKGSYMKISQQDELAIATYTYLNKDTELNIFTNLFSSRDYISEALAFYNKCANGKIKKPIEMKTATYGFEGKVVNYDIISDIDEVKKNDDYLLIKYKSKIDSSGMNFKIYHIYFPEKAVSTQLVFRSEEKININNEVIENIIKDILESK